MMDDFEGKTDLYLTTVKSIKEACENGAVAAIIGRLADVPAYKISCAANYGKAGKSYSRPPYILDADCNKILEVLKNPDNVLTRNVDPSENFESTLVRIRSAASSGFKISTLSRLSGVGAFRLNSFVSNSKSYDRISRLTEDECHAINKALDAIKEAF